MRTNERFGRAQRSVDRRPSLEVSIRVAEEAAERPPSQSHNRLLSHDAAEAFETARSFASFYVWPGEQRTGGDRRGALHAKTVLADGSTAFVTSANLTGHGLGDNMELGLLVRAGHLPVRLTAHFDELVAHDVLRRVSAG